MNTASNGHENCQMTGPEAERKTICLGELFNNQQLAHISSVCRASHGDVFAAARQLKPYFAGMRAHLESKGLVPEYAAYAIPYHLMSAVARAAESN